MTKVRQLGLVAACGVAAFLGNLAGANVAPRLTGDGKVLFPEHSPSAAVSASGGSLQLLPASGSGIQLFGDSPAASIADSSGQITITAGGTNQNITLAPTGTGYTQVGNAFIGKWPANTNYTFVQNAALAASGAGNFALAQNSNGNTLLNAGAAGAAIFYRINNADVAKLSTTGFCVGATCSASYPLDITGAVNTSTGYKVGGTAGFSGTATSTHGGGTCVLTISGGIITAATGC